MPNVVLIMTDEQKADSLSVYGNPVVRTPNLERLALRGVTFTSAFTPYPVCVPSRVMTFTGRYAHTTRSRSNSVLMQPEEDHLLAAVVRSGYTAGLVGKNHCFDAKGLQLFDYIWQCGHGGPADPPTEDAAAAVQFIRDSQITRRAWGTATNPYPPEALGTALTVDQAIGFLERQGGDPFFLWCSIADPHTPLQTAEPYASMYDPSDVPVPEQLAGEISTKPVAQQIDYRALAGDKATEEDIRRVTAMYFGMVTYIDNEVGRLLDTLQRQGLSEDTIVVYMSDHGDYMGEHGMIRKSKALYDCLMRVPLILSWPARFRQGERLDDLVEVVDIAPTILDCLGLPHPTGSQGRSLAPLLEGGRYSPREAVFGEIGVESQDGRCDVVHSLDDIRHVPEGATTPDFSPAHKLGGLGPIRCVRTRDWKLVYYPGNREGELYDLQRDPGELVNLWGIPGQQARVSELSARLLDWCIQTEDRRPPLSGSPF